MLAPEDMALLSKASYALRLYGRVQDISTSREIGFDPYRITHEMQATTIAHMDKPPRDANGFSKWLIVAKYRQGGESTTVASCGYCKAQYIPGWTHVTMADNAARSKYLFSRVAYMHGRWPDELRVPLLTEGQHREYEWEHNGKMQVLTGGTEGAGVGRSADSWHWSEVPLWSNAAGQWTDLLPAIIQRKDAMMVMESTPFTLAKPSTDFFMSMCEQARKGDSRFEFVFYPFWDGKKNARPWNPAWGDGDSEEQALLETYGRFGLTKPNLAFRREIMNLDGDIRRNPDLFRVYYPFDDLTCWISRSGAAIPGRYLDRHLPTLREVPRGADYWEFDPPKQGAHYVIGVDPSGYGLRDHCAFHVFEIWSGLWKQVAVFSSGAVDPPELARRLFNVGRRYNWAQINIERNYDTVSASLITMEYPELFYQVPGKPGTWKSSEKQVLEPLIDALDNLFVIRDRDTIQQCRTYKSDWMVQQTEKQQALGRNSPGRRGKHHWDKVSALMMIPFVAKRTIQVRPPMEEFAVRTVVPFSGMTVRELERYDKRVREARERMTDHQRRSGRLTRYRTIRRGHGRE